MAEWCPYACKLSLQEGRAPRRSDNFLLRQVHDGEQGEACVALSEGRRGAELVGRELHIKASFLTHSCAPNCLVVRGTAGRATVVAQRPIAVSNPQPLQLPRIPGMRTIAYYCRQGMS